MNKHLCTTVLSSVLLTLVSFAPHALAQEETCGEFVELAANAVPEELGDPEFVRALLRPEVTPQLSENFDPEKAQKILRDVLREVDPCVDCSRTPNAHQVDRSPKRGETLLRGTDGTLLRAELSRGQIVYLNRKRGHDPVGGHEVEVSADAALELAFEIADAIGVPVAEMDREYAEVRELIAAGRDPAGRLEATRQRAEVHVRVPRRIGRFPVFDSYFQVAIGAREMIARLRVKWPDFKLVSGLLPETVLDRDQAVAEIVEKLSESALCGSLKQVIGEIAYVQADQLAISSSRADIGDREESRVDLAFAPALVVYAVPVTPEEDSGQVGFAGLQFVMPLLEIKGDVAGSDKTIDESSAEQSDR